jgi:hypothetical protein
MMSAISSLSSLDASMGSLLDVDSSFFSSVALDATGCASGMEETSCSMIFFEPLIINSKLTNFPITSSGDISVCWGPSASEGPKKRVLTMFSKYASRYLRNQVAGIQKHGQDEA